MVCIAGNGIEAAVMIAELQPELAFLDIQMPGFTGLEVAQGIEGATRVVFVTAHDEYAVQVFDHAALDYVLQPVKIEWLARTLQMIRAARTPALPDARLTEASTKLMAAPPQAQLRYMRAAQGERMHQLAVDDVLFFHADDKYTVVRTAMRRNCRSAGPLSG